MFHYFGHQALFFSPCFMAYQEEEKLIQHHIIVAHMRKVSGGSYSLWLLLERLRGSALILTILADGKAPQSWGPCDDMLSHKCCSVSSRLLEDDAQLCELPTSHGAMTWRFPIMSACLYMFLETFKARSSDADCMFVKKTSTRAFQSKVSGPEIHRSENLWSYTMWNWVSGFIWLL